MTNKTFKPVDTLRAKIISKIKNQLLSDIVDDLYDYNVMPDEMKYSYRITPMLKAINSVFPDTGYEQKFSLKKPIATKQLITAMVLADNIRLHDQAEMIYTCIFRAVAAKQNSGKDGLKNADELVKQINNDYGLLHLDADKLRVNMAALEKIATEDGFTKAVTAVKNHIKKVAEKTAEVNIEPVSKYKAESVAPVVENKIADIQKTEVVATASDPVKETMVKPVESPVIVAQGEVTEKKDVVKENADKLILASAIAPISIHEVTSAAAEVKNDNVTNAPATQEITAVPAELSSSTGLIVTEHPSSSQMKSARHAGFWSVFSNIFGTASSAMGVHAEIDSPKMDGY